MKKPTVNTLAFGNLKTRKKQYTLMIIGIILAMIFSSGSMFLVSSISNGLKDLACRQVGYQDLIFNGLTDEMLKDGIDKLSITEYADGENLGLVFTEDESAGATVAKMSDEANRMYYTRVIEGRYPENEGEIAIESDAAVRMKIKAKVGEKVTLNLKVQSGNDYLPDTVSKTYTLVGIIGNRRNYVSSYYGGNLIWLPAAFVSEKESIEPGGKTQRVTFIDCSDDFVKRDYSTGDVFDFYEPYKNELGNSYDRFIITFMSQSGGIGRVSASSMTAVILAVVLMLVSCVGIVNAFNANLLERKKQIGFLRALGTTRRQIIKIYGREALILTLICTPVSLVVSFFGTKLLVSLLGDMIFLPDWKVLAVGGAVSVACVMLAALIPLVRASKISPMQAVRNIDIARKMKHKRIHSQKTFTVPGLMAKRSMTFGRGRTAAVSVILVVCILLSGLGFSFVNYIKDDGYNSTADYEIMMANGYIYPYENSVISERKFGVSENGANDILTSPYVEKVSGSEYRRAVISVDRESDYLRISDYGNCISGGLFVGGHMEFCDFTKENYAEIMEQLRLEDYQRVVAGNPEAKYDESYGKNTSKEDYKKAYSPTGEFSEVDLYASEADYINTLKKSVVEGKIDIDKLNSGEEIILEANRRKGLVLYQDMYEIGLSVEPIVVPVDKDGNVLSYRIGASKNERVTLIESAELDLHAGDEVEVSVLYNRYNDSEGCPNNLVYDERYTERVTRKVKIGAIVETESSNDFRILTTNQGYRFFGFGSHYTELDVFLNNECTPEIDESVCELIEPIVSGTGGLYNSMYQVKQEEEETYRTLLTAVISVILLMATICTSLINNALTARIRESKKEIGTLRAVGASVSELTKSYILQLLSMFGTGTVCGFLLYFLGIAGGKIYAYVTTDSDLLMSFNLWIPLVVCAVIFVICSVNLRLKIREQTKASIVENIREL